MYEMSYECSGLLFGLKAARFMANYCFTATTTTTTAIATSSFCLTGLFFQSLSWSP